MTESMLKKVADRVKLAVGKALLKAVKDDGQIQLVKITGLADETQEDVERVQPYGLTTNPPLDSEAVVVYMNGNRDHGVVIVTDSGEYRIKNLVSGEVAVYSQFGQIILLAADGTIKVTASETIHGNGDSYVALASKVDALWTALWGVFNGWTPVYETALKTYFMGAFPTAPDTVGSSNLKADE